MGMRLKSLVPSISKEKVSKATILQQTAEYIEKLEREKKQMKQLLQAQNSKNSEMVVDVKEEINIEEINNSPVPQISTERSEGSTTSSVDASLLGNLGNLNSPSLERARQ